MAIGEQNRFLMLCHIQIIFSLVPKFIVNCKTVLIRVVFHVKSAILVLFRFVSVF